MLAAERCEALGLCALCGVSLQPGEPRPTAARSTSSTASEMEGGRVTIQTARRGGSAAEVLCASSIVLLVEVISRDATDKCGEAPTSPDLNVGAHVAAPPKAIGESAPGAVRLPEGLNLEGSGLLLLPPPFPASKRRMSSSFSSALVFDETIDSSCHGKQGRLMRGRTVAYHVAHQLIVLA